MKKYFIFLTILFFLFSLNRVFAQESASLSSSQKASEKVEYDLPYPGLLPDSPLYLLKVTRDRIVGFLIGNPLKKAEFNLLQADKRLAAGVYLLNLNNKTKEGLAISTISKGENYFEQALEKTREAKKQGTSTIDISRRMSLSSRKHLEVLKDLERKASGDTKKSIRFLIERVSNFEKQANF